MKRLLVAALLASTAVPALAADLPSRKGAPEYIPYPPAMTWTGFYAGVNVGYGWGTSGGVPVAGWGSNASAGAWNGLNALVPANVPIAFGAGLGGVGLANTGFATVDQHGFIGGGQIGYNYQVGSFVIGLETDIQGSAIRGSGGYAGAGIDPYGLSIGNNAFNVFNQSHVGGGEIRAGVDWIGTVRARLGYAVMPSLMLYATGGLAYGNVWAQQNFSSVSSANLGAIGGQFAGLNLLNQTLVGAGRIDQTNVGYSVGGGFEWLLSQNWSVKGEALYYSLGSATLNGTGSAAPAFNLAGIAPGLGPVIPGTGALGVATQSNVNFDGVIARVGLNRHFSF